MIKIDDLATEIEKELKNYSQDIADGVKADVKQVAKECRDEIKRNSPRLTGDYAKGWRTETNFESREDIRITVHNKTDYQLTHLLEDGHAGRGGTSKGAAPPYPHIGPAEENAAKKLEERVTVRVTKR